MLALKRFEANVFARQPHSGSSLSSTHPRLVSDRGRARASHSGTGAPPFCWVMSFGSRCGAVNCVQESTRVATSAESMSRSFLRSRSASHALRGRFFIPSKGLRSVGSIRRCYRELESTHRQVEGMTTFTLRERAIRLIAVGIFVAAAFSMADARALAASSLTPSPSPTPQIKTIIHVRAKANRASRSLRHQKRRANIKYPEHPQHLTECRGILLRRLRARPHTSFIPRL